ncbi:MAG: hypothetical protein KGO81_10855 [Bacteroidota bacterium]|nr:hypothetical protein [Bacteroidota bacterium]
MLFNNQKVKEIFNDNFIKASNVLKTLDFYSNRHTNEEINFRGLVGWVFEETIFSCLNNELNSLNLRHELKVQFNLSSLFVIGKKSKGKADLYLHTDKQNYLIELKHTGVFGIADYDKYRKYREIVNNNNFKYLYLTKGESYEKFVTECKNIFGSENAFFLDKDGDWEKFINLIQTDNL